MLDWLVLPAETEADEDGVATLEDEPVEPDEEDEDDEEDEPEDEPDDELAALSVPACQACWANSPRLTALAVTTAPTASLTRVINAKLFMAQPCGQRLAPPCAPAVGKLWMMAS
ncbi:MAG: hypothetical protein M3Y42_19625 [Actinomycetota bacterium]|nr:hypothetical protein [Actinomycetota bacterium]MDQ2959154.1 hypothetical protein [Actinomycetota bacterium]